MWGRPADNLFCWESRKLWRIIAHFIDGLKQYGMLLVPRLLTWMGLIPAWISNHTTDKVGWNYLSTSKRQRLNVEVWEWTGSFIPHFMIDVITYPWSKTGPRRKINLRWRHNAMSKNMTSARRLLVLWIYIVCSHLGRRTVPEWRACTCMTSYMVSINFLVSVKFDTTT